MQCRTSRVAISALYHKIFANSPNVIKLASRGVIPRTGSAGPDLYYAGEFWLVEIVYQ